MKSGRIFLIFSLDYHFITRGKSTLRDKFLYLIYDFDIL